VVFLRLHRQREGNIAIELLAAVCKPTKNTCFSIYIYIYKTIILPRQARDKQGKLKKRCRFCKFCSLQCESHKKTSLFI
jgi:hypothetical protein